MLPSSDMCTTKTCHGLFSGTHLVYQENSTNWSLQFATLVSWARRRPQYSPQIKTERLNLEFDPVKTKSNGAPFFFLFWLNVWVSPHPFLPQHELLPTRCATATRASGARAAKSWNTARKRSSSSTRKPGVVEPGGYSGYRSGSSF